MLLFSRPRLVWSIGRWKTDEKRGVVDVDGDVDELTAHLLLLLCCPRCRTHAPLKAGDDARARLQKASFWVVGRGGRAVSMSVG